MNGAKITVEKYWAELKAAEAKPRSAVGNQVATTRALHGKDGASASPTMKRRANSRLTAAAPVKKPTAPCITVKADHRVMLTA